MTATKQSALENSHAEVAAALARGLRNTSFYTCDHPIVRLNTEEIHSALERLLDKRQEAVLKVVESELVIDDKPLLDSHIGTANLIGACVRRGVESVTFLRGLTVEEVAAFINLLISEPEYIETEGGAGAALGRKGVVHIRAERLYEAQSDKTELTDVTRKNYASAIDVLRATARRARLGASPEAGPTHQVVGDLIDSIIYEHASMLGMVSVKGRDEYTFTHALHICILCLELGLSLGLSREHLQQLGVCAMLHDIGKIFVPLPILRKPAALTPREFSIIQQHPAHGALLLCRHEDAPAMAPLVAFEHHLHFDYSGYPQTSARRELNFYSMMVGPADVYDALTTDRPYRPALSPQQALEVMHAQASQFEPRILTRFLEMLGKYPAGSLLRLTDGRLAVVSKTNPQEAEAPFVRIVEKGETGPRLAPTEISLAAKDSQSGARKLGIDSVVDAAPEGLDVIQMLGGNLFYTE